MAERASGKVGIIGWSVEHSLSPRLHNFWLKQYNIAGEYIALAVKPEELSQAIAQIEKEKWLGFNITIPHKEAIMPLLDSMDEGARNIGAVNTVTVKDGKFFGQNTDIYGFWENIRPKLKAKNKAVVLGAGGAARAIVEALIENDFKQIIITNRTEDRAHAIAGGRAEICSWDERAGTLKDANLLVNTTSLGMQGNAPLDIDLAKLPQVALVNDIVYSPLMTPLLIEAQNRGNLIADGLGMLLYQAVPAFEAWFGIRPQVSDDLRQHILDK